MRRSIKFLTGLLMFGCANEYNTFQDITERGGYVVFTEEPRLSFNILKLDTEVFSATLFDPNENATGYTLTVMYDDVMVENVFQTTTFPATLEFSIAEILEMFNLTADDIGLADKITFVAKVTTPDGVFDGRSPDYDFNNINQGGDTTDRLKYPGQHNAMEFSFSFYQPPGRKIRGTSFEEVPVGPDDAVYDRNGANDETLDLVNGADPPYVDYVSKGTGTDDELGFDSEYIAITNISESSLGFSEERIGVTALLENFEAYPDGVQGFHSEDADGAIKITFDTVEVPEEQNNSGISFQVFFGDTSWEELDGIHAYANITTDEGDDVLELISAYNNDVETLAGRWQEVNSGFLKGIRSYQLVIQIQSGATPEFFDLDNIFIYEPEED